MPRFAPTLLSAIVAIMVLEHAAHAHVMPVASGSFRVIAEVAASCSIDTRLLSGAPAPDAALCNGTTPSYTTTTPVGALTDPTDAERTAAADTRAVLIVY